MPIHSVPLFVYAVIVHVVLTIASLKKVVFLGRFPNQDLFWNDLQLFRTYRWFKELLESQGVQGLLFADTDFLLNYGESVYASTKATSFLFDIGNWIYALTGSLQLAIGLRYILLTSIGAIGSYLLLTRGSQNVKVYWKSKLLFILVFSVVDGSIIFHPQLTYEVGFLNSWFFLLVPAWIALFQYSKSYKISHLLSFSFLLTCLSLGVTDIHFPVFIFSIFITILLLNDFRVTKSLIIVFSASILLFGLDRVVWLESFFAPNETSNRGVYLPNYLTDFIFPYLWTLIAYNFNGPISLFIGLITPCLLIYAFSITKKVHRKMFWISIKAVSVSGLILTVSGTLLHSIPVFAEFMPSGWRYPFGILPFLFLSISAMLFCETLSEKGSITIVGAIMVVALLSQLSLVQALTSPYYRVIYDSTLRNQFLNELPNCIDDKLTKSGVRQQTRSMIFAAPQFAEDYPTGRDDTLLFLTENPLSLHGRTFNQWRHGASSAYIREFGFFAWPYSVKDPRRIEEAITATESNVLLSTKRLDLPKLSMNLIGVCVNSVDNDSIYQRNQTLGRSVFVYKINGLKFNSRFAQIKSSQVTVEISCEKVKANRQSLLSLPVAYRGSIYAMQGSTEIPALAKEGKVWVSSSFCDKLKAGSAYITLSSRNILVAFHHLIFVFLLVAQFLYLIYDRLTFPRLKLWRRMRDLNPR